MATDTWQSIAQAKQQQNLQKIPQEWRLPTDILSKVSPKATYGVLDIPRSCGMLSEREVQLTENYDASALLVMLAKGEVRYSHDLWLKTYKPVTHTYT